MYDVYQPILGRGHLGLSVLSLELYILLELCYSLCVNIRSKYLPGVNLRSKFTKYNLKKQKTQKQQNVFFSLGGFRTHVLWSCRRRHITIILYCTSGGVLVLYKHIQREVFYAIYHRAVGSILISNAVVCGRQL